jgi:two-component system, chemotaxis family, chemotaxis protein CheY
MKIILVVDDSAIIRKVARRILEEANLQVVEAENGAAAFEACRQTMPDGVLLDGAMPIMDGIQFLGQLRAAPGGDRPRVVFCTTENDVSRIARAFRAGADAYVLKPFDQPLLISKFEEVGLLAPS